MAALTLSLANTIAAAALARARELKLRPMGIAVLDAAGHTICVQREDGATPFRIEIARGKAWAAVQMGASSRALTERARDLPAFFGALAVAGEGHFIPQTGAVLVKDAAGQVLGAVGASGGTGDEDEAICIAGVGGAGLVHG